MYRLSVRFHFDAAHFLKHYEGKCANLHGHTWQVVLKIACEALDDVGIAIDFRTVKEAVKPILDELDHKALNELPYFDKLNPTAENISHKLTEALAKPIADLGATLSEVEVWESLDCSASYVA